MSLDGGTAATYDAIRGVDAFDLLLEGVRAVRAGGVPVTTRTTVQQANYREIPLIIEAAKGGRCQPHQLFDGGCEQSIRLRDRALMLDGSLPLIANMGSPAPAEHGPPASALTAEDVCELATCAGRRGSALRRRFCVRANRRIARQTAPHDQLFRRDCGRGRVSIRALQCAAHVRRDRSRWNPAPLLLFAQYREGGCKTRASIEWGRGIPPAKRSQFTGSGCPAPRLSHGRTRRMPALCLSVV